MLKKFFSVLVLALSFMFTSCDDKSNNSNSGVSQPPASGAWKVVYFFDRSDETSHYSGYTFEFNDNGDLVANKGAQTYTGSWSDNCDDSSNKFCISFSSNAPSELEEISEDWRVIEITDNKLSFEHVSGGDGHVEVLRFEK